MQAAWALSFAGTALLPLCSASPRRNALGQSLDLILPEHLRASHWSGFEAAITKGMKLQGRPTLTRALHKSGRKLYVEMTFAIVKGEAEDEVLGSEIGRAHV